MFHFLIKYFLGYILIIFGCFWIYVNYSINKTAIFVEGTVVQYVPAQVPRSTTTSTPEFSFSYGNNTNTEMDFSKNISSLIEYQHNTTSYKVVDTHSSNQPLHAIGEKVKMRFVPNEPEKGQISTFSRDYLIGILSIIVGITVLLFYRLVSFLIRKLTVHGRRHVESFIKKNQ